MPENLTLRVEHGWLTVRTVTGWLLWSKKATELDNLRGADFTAIGREIEKNYAEWQRDGGGEPDAYAEAVQRAQLRG